MIKKHEFEPDTLCYPTDIPRICVFEDCGLPPEAEVHQTPNLTLETVLWAAANFISGAPDKRPPDQREVVLKGLGWAIERYTRSEVHQLTPSIDPTHRCNGVNGAERHGTSNKCTVCGEYREGWYDSGGMEILVQATDTVANQGPPAGLDLKRFEMQLCDAVQIAIGQYRCTHIVDADDLQSGLPLVDVFTPPQCSSIKTGEVEVELLVDYVCGSIVDAFRSLPAAARTPVSQPDDEEAFQEAKHRAQQIIIEQFSVLANVPHGLVGRIAAELMKTNVAGYEQAREDAAKAECSWCGQGIRVEFSYDAFRHHYRMTDIEGATLTEAMQKVREFKEQQP